MKKLTLLVCLSLFIACSSSKSPMPRTAADLNNVSDMSIEYAPTGAQGNTAGGGEQSPSEPVVTAAPASDKTKERFVIHNANMTIAVKQVQSAIVATEAIAKKYEGFVVSSSKMGESKYFNPDEGNLTIRVPDAKLDSAIDEISALGRVKYRAVSGQDVTAQYTDLQLRLANKEKMLEKLRELLTRAENTTVALEVEKEINRITLEIEQIKGNLIYLKDQLNFSTIDIRIEKRHQPGPLGLVFYGIGFGFGKLFVWN